MSLSPKQRGKISKSVPKHASVSLDCLLGLLSSAYGTEQIEPAILCKNRIESLNCKNNLVVEHARDGTLIENSVNGLKANIGLRNEGTEKISVATSTTSLKSNCIEVEKEDSTRILPKIMDCPEHMLYRQEHTNSDSKCCDSGIIISHEGETMNDFKSLEQVPTLSCVGLDLSTTKDIGEICDNGKYDPESVICEFHANGGNLTFGIQFTKINSLSPNRPTDFNHLMLNTDEPEIIINLNDLLKSTWITVNLSKRSLVSKSQHFFNVDKEFGLEKLDVFVKCNNLNVLKWVFQWLKSELSMFKPNISIANVNGILFIAYHLQIDQLIEDCLYFFHSNYNKILDTHGYENIDCVINKLLFKLVIRFCNSEIDAMNNDFEILQTKLFCTLIQMLVDKNPCQTVGHYSSLATMFQCENCKKIFNYEMKNIVACRADCNQFNVQGQLVPIHECSTIWNLSRYIEVLYDKMTSWRKVYWRLWGMCHYLVCNQCHITYPVCQSEWCPYHSEDVEYFPMFANLCYPIGVYRCCGEISFKFNVLNDYAGCNYKCHVPVLNSIDDENIYRIYQSHKDIISVQPPVNNVTLNRNVKLVTKSDEILTMNGVKRESFWWQGLQIVPKIKQDYSIIPRKLFNKLKNRLQTTKYPYLNYHILHESQIAMGSIPLFAHSISSFTSYDEDSKKVKFKVNSFKTKSSTKLPLAKNRIRKKKSSSYAYDPVESLWNCSDSIKDNQDKQREFEEIAMHSLVEMLSPDTSGVVPKSTAGTYIRLEADWWQDNCYDSKTTGYNKNSGTVVNRTFPLSWFRRLTI